MAFLIVYYMSNFFGSPLDVDLPKFLFRDEEIA